jgi:DNA-directed RNA polymerase sigma subunit (sigma70/sigma32)|tara:strand:- start:102 stop:353 length:252 start_codon:yes stop_codon:yes gene_type:complete
MNLFKKVADMPKKTKSVPQSYKPVLEAQEVIDLFSRLTLHQQAALMRLISRNLEVVVGEDRYMGYELDYEVVGAIIRASETLD